jgi:hypothetical protein
MRGLTFEKPKKRYSLSECYANFLTILRIYRTTMFFKLNFCEKNKIISTTFLLSVTLICSLLVIHIKLIQYGPNVWKSRISRFRLDGKGRAFKTKSTITIKKRIILLNKNAMNDTKSPLKK